MRSIASLVALTFALLALGCGDDPGPADGGDGGEGATGTPAVVEARAELEPTEGNDVRGTVTFRRDGDVVVVRAEVTGLTPGKHGFHIHEHGDCSAPDASSAGGHFDPTGQPHGAPTDEERHVGDLGNLEADEDGRATLTWRDPVITLDGPNSIVGKAVVVHAGEDDLTSQPSGDAGARLACGVIETAGD